MDKPIEHFDVAVIGCGILGASTTYFCAKSGLKVICCEQFATQEHSNGSSYGLSRCWRYAYTDINYANMAKESLKLWKNLENESGIKLINFEGGCDLVPKHCKTIEKSILDACKKTYSSSERYKIISDFKNANNNKHAHTRHWKNIFNINHLTSNNYNAIWSEYYGTINANRALNTFINQTKKLYPNTSMFKFNCKFQNLNIKQLNKNDSSWKDNNKNNNVIIVNCIENDGKENKISFSCNKIIFCMGGYTESFFNQNRQNLKSIASGNDKFTSSRSSTISSCDWLRPIINGKPMAMINHVLTIPAALVMFESKNDNNRNIDIDCMSKMPVVAEYGLSLDGKTSSTELESPKECTFYSMCECSTTPLGKKWILKVGNAVSPDETKEEIYNLEKQYNRILNWTNIVFNKNLNLKMISKRICWNANTPSRDYIVSDCSQFCHDHDQTSNININKDSYLRDIWFVIGGHAFKQAPIIGKYISDCICNKVKNKSNYCGINWTFVDAARNVPMSYYNKNISSLKSKM